MIKLTVDLLACLKDAGYSSYRLRRDKLLGESVLTKLRSGGLPSWNEMNVICRLLNRQPDFLEYIPDREGSVESAAEERSPAHSQQDEEATPCGDNQGRGQGLVGGVTSPKHERG